MTAATGEETEDLVFHVMAFSDCVYLFFFSHLFTHPCHFLPAQQTSHQARLLHPKKKSGILNHTPFFFYCGRAKKSCFFPERNRRMQRRFPMSRQAAYGEEEIPPRLQSGTGARERQERDGTIHDRGIPLRKPCGLLLATQRWSLACGSSQQQPSCVSAMLFRRRPEELFDIHHSDASVIWRMR